jgi:hypothetical protein
MTLYLDAASVPMQVINGATAYPPRVRVTGPSGNINVPVSDGASALILTLPSLVVPIGTKVNISGMISLHTTVSAIRSVVIFPEIVSGTTIGDSAGGNSVPSGAGFGVCFPLSSDYTTTTTNPVFLIHAWCTTGGASSGDLVVDGAASWAVAVEVA